MRRGAEEIGASVSSAATSVVDKARASFYDATDTLKFAAKETLTETAATVNAASSAAEHGAKSLNDTATQAAKSGRDALTSFVTKNPLLVAGIASAVGAFIAASIPASEAENRLFGKGSEKLQNKAREAAAEGIEKIGDIAADAAGSVTAAAAREGLDASGVGQALNTVAESVRAVADRGLDTALG